MNTTGAEIIRRVVERANGRCEYCRMHQSLQGATFHVEHIIPRSGGGTDDESNLCLACPSCNLHKSSRTRGMDSLTGEMVELFHPRIDEWDRHFRWEEFTLVGVSAIGRATVVALEMNAARRLRIREAEGMFDLFPPR